MDLEKQELEAGEQVMNEIKRYLQFLGKQFMLESDIDSDMVVQKQSEATMGGSHHQKPSDLKKSQGLLQKSIGNFIAARFGSKAKALGVSNANMSQFMKATSKFKQSI